MQITRDRDKMSGWTSERTWEKMEQYHMLDRGSGQEAMCFKLWVAKENVNISHH